MSAAGGAASDQRKYSRHALRYTVAFAGDHISHQGTIEDISLGGCRVASDAAIFAGEFIAMLIQLPGRDTALEISLAVVRWAIASHFGVEFIRLESAQRALLEQIIEKARRTSAPSRPRDVASPRHTQEALLWP